jgi:hypothetical protein
MKKCLKNYNFFLSFCQKKWGWGGWGKHIGSIMSMLGNNCQWVIYVVFSSIPTYTTGAFLGILGT